MPHKCGGSPARRCPSAATGPKYSNFVHKSLRSNRYLETDTPRRWKLPELESIDAPGAYGSLGIDVGRLGPHEQVSHYERCSHGLRSETRHIAQRERGTDPSL